MNYTLSSWTIDEQSLQLKAKSRPIEVVGSILRQGRFSGKLYDVSSVSSVAGLSSLGFRH